MAEPVRSIADFLAVTRKSGLIEDDRLASAVASLTDTTAELPDELPQALIDASLLTQWQVEQLRKGKHKGFMLGKYRLLRLLGAAGELEAAHAPPPAHPMHERAACGGGLREPP